jgi:diguanylate cyclase (GGDEF)-like protein
VFGNTALRNITGYDDGDLSRFGSVAELIYLDRKAADAADALASGAEPQAAHLFAKDGRRVDVEVSRRTIRADAGEREVWIVRDVTAQHRAESSLRDQALHDVLTGLPNRALLEDRLRVAIVAAQRRNACVSVMLLDLDRFKQVNDVFGHKAGDAVLVEIAKRLRIALRSTDTVARLGGDEFVVVLPDTSLAGADLAAASMLTSVGAPISFESKYVEVGVSIGITMHPGHGDDAETLLRRADLAMYAAKKAGGGSTIFTPWLESASPATRT